MCDHSIYANTAYPIISAYNSSMCGNAQGRPEAFAGRCVDRNGNDGNLLLPIVAVDTVKNPLLSRWRWTQDASYTVAKTVPDPFGFGQQVANDFPHPRGCTRVGYSLDVNGQCSPGSAHQQCLKTPDHGCVKTCGP